MAKTKPDDLKGTNNKAALMHALFGVYWTREEEIRGKRSGYKFKNRNDFEHCFELLAVQSWKNGDMRSITRADVEIALAGTPYANRLGLMAESGDDELPPLLAAFFFSAQAGAGPGSAAQQHDGRGVEFTHKSFAEFLYVRHLIRIWRNALPNVHDNPEAFLQDWGDVTGGQAMTYPIHNLLREEITRPRSSMDDDPSVDPNADQEQLRPLLERAIKDGIQPKGSTAAGLPTIRTIARASLNAEEALFVLFHAYWFIAHGDKADARWRIGWGGRRGLARMLSRLNDASIQLPVGRLFGHDLFQFRSLLTTFHGANLIGADLRSAILRGANLSGANLIDVRNLDEARWDESTQWPAGFTPP